MCLNFCEKANIEVMSSSDSSVHLTVSSSTTHNIENASPSPAVNQGELNEGNLSSQRDSVVIQSSSSSSDLEAKDSSLHRLSSNSELIDPSQQRDLSSFDGSTYDDKSAFEITSVRPASDDHDRSAVRNPLSTDSLTLRNEMGGKPDADDSNTPSSVKQQGLSSDGSTIQPTKAHFSVGSPKEDESQPIGVEDEVATPSTTNVSQGLGVTTLPKDPIVPAYPSNASSSAGGSVVGGGGGAIASNGNSVQPNRFRRVNQYERGRWTVRDSLVTEEQEVTTTTSATTVFQNTKQFPNNVKQPDAVGGECLSNGTPPRTLQQRQELPPTAAPTAAITDPSHCLTTDLVNLPGNAGSNVAPVGGGLGLNDATSDRDSSSIHMDRSSTAAETISRNTSMSSIVPEKSIDGEELLQDSEVDSNSGAGGGGGESMLPSAHNQEHDFSELPVTSNSTQPVLSIASVGAVPPPSSTAIPRHQDPTPQSTSSYSDFRKESEGDVDFQRVKNAMSLLQDELQLVLTSTSNASLMEENKALKERITKLEEENARLKKLEDENSRLKQELRRLKDSLSILAREEDSSLSLNSDQGTSSGTLSSGHETSSSSQSQGCT